MRSLSSQDILAIWEQGRSQHWLDRALTILAIALPEQSRDNLAQLSIGQRDGQLLTVREWTFGPTLESVTTCPHCGETLEFTMEVADLRVREPPISIESPVRFADFECEVRLPNSWDVAAVLASSNLAQARQQLSTQCLQSVRQSGVAIAPEALPNPILTQLSSYLAECDPQADLLINLVCPACQHQWQVLFDIVNFLWTEISLQAKRLLREVHLLALCYGWTEQEILSMSPTRRSLYLEMVV